MMLRGTFYIDIYDHVCYNGSSLCYGYERDEIYETTLIVSGGIYHLTIGTSEPT